MVEENPDSRRRVCNPSAAKAAVLKVVAYSLKAVPFCAVSFDHFFRF
jgi:hypothetical protein